MISLLHKSIKNNLDKNAFCIDNEFFSYKDLHKKVCNIYEAIILCEIKQPVTVGIISTNTIETYASILACWFSGNSYVPINPRMPKNLNTSIVQLASPELILTSEEDVDEIFDNANAIRVIKTKKINNSENTFNVAELKDKSLLYILFTSGSTGLPKGVPISYSNICNFLDSYNALGFECSSEDRFLQMFDLTFDVSVASFLVPLLNGACVYTVSSEGIKYINVYNIIKTYKLTYATIVPSIINYFRPYLNNIQLPFLKYCILTAEASNINLVTEWAKCVPNGNIVNLYGPTEATIWCTAYFFQPDSGKSYNEMLPIGYPFKCVEALILNEEGVEVIKGTKGQLSISSTQLTDGYLNDIYKNNNSFFSKNGKRFYKTGDLCFIGEDNDIFYCGRIDHQVKIQGFRIELSEIEVSVRNLFNLSNVAVSYKNKMGVDNICLFIEGLECNEEVIKNGLEKKLPYYMMPSQIRRIASLPYNTNGKVDRVSLTLSAANHG